WLHHWPQQCPEALPHQHQDGNVVYERVRTYSCPGGKRVQVLELPPCSPRPVSPLENAPGHQHVIWSRDPPQQVHSPPSPSPLPPSGRGRGLIKTNAKCSVLEGAINFTHTEWEETLDSRYFGELLAEVNRKSNDLYSCLLQHVEKIGRRTQDNESTSQVEDIEGLIPKGLSELTKQQIRYLLQMRVTSDKSLRLVLSTFGSLREELCHLQDDLGKLETDKMLLEKDLAFKESQVKEYETLLASVRENNRQQQQGLRDSASKCRSLEEQIISLRYAEGEKDCRLKELEYCKRALEQEIQNLRMQTCSNPVIQTTTDELSSRYVEMINNLREDKDREIRNLRSQINQFQQDISRRDGSNSDFQMRLHELTSMLEDKETFIKQQQEELFRLKQERLSCNQSTGVTKYMNQYPILGLLSDDYMVSSPVRQTETIVIEKTEAM
uniref:POF1B actin binding protein n=1 Tax=Chelonoidis abingdonii TaxID=106734 RepID=A0A8C0GD13_CHEAB